MRLADDGSDKIEAYAVLPATVDWNGREPYAGDAEEIFGSAFTFEETRVFVSSDSGGADSFGFLEVGFPVNVTLSCWNYGSLDFRNDGSGTNACDDAPRPSRACTRVRPRVSPA